MNSHGCSTTVYQLPRAPSLVWGPWGAAVVRAHITFLYAHCSSNLLRSTIVCKGFQVDYWKVALFPAPVLPGPFLIPPGPMGSGVRAAPIWSGRCSLGKRVLFPQGACKLSLPQGRGKVKFLYICILSTSKSKTK